MRKSSTLFKLSYYFHALTCIRKEIMQHTICQKMVFFWTRIFWAITEQVNDQPYEFFHRPYRDPPKNWIKIKPAFCTWILMDRFRHSKYFFLCSQQLSNISFKMFYFFKRIIFSSCKHDGQLYFTHNFFLLHVSLQCRSYKLLSALNLPPHFFCTPLDKRVFCL